MRPHLLFPAHQFTRCKQASRQAEYTRPADDIQVRHHSPKTLKTCARWAKYLPAPCDGGVPGCGCRQPPDAVEWLLPDNFDGIVHKDRISAQQNRFFNVCFDPCLPRGMSIFLLSGFLSCTQVGAANCKHDPLRCETIAGPWLDRTWISEQLAVPFQLRLVQGTFESSAGWNISRAWGNRGPHAQSGNKPRRDHSTARVILRPGIQRARGARRSPAGPDCPQDRQQQLPQARFLIPATALESRSSS